MTADPRDELAAALPNVDEAWLALQEDAFLDQYPWTTIARHRADIEAAIARSTRPEGIEEALRTVRDAVDAMPEATVKGYSGAPVRLVFKAAVLRELDLVIEAAGHA